MQGDADRAGRPFAPRWPTLTATGWFVLWIAILSLPMWGGAFLASPWSDQYATGYAFRQWGAEQWKALGHVPLWNPEIFGGLPFVAAMHGDIFYPTAWLRLLLPTAVAMNIGFVVHYVLAGLFTYLLARLLGVTWTGSVVAGAAYQLSGVVASYVSPGHDGKLFVTALLPLALIGLVLALRRARVEGYALLALTVGLALLSPHYQMVYYLLIVAGLFALCLTVGRGGGRPLGDRATGLALALAAVVLGFGVAMIQVLPFYEYLPYSPRAEGYGGFAASASYGVPWEHVPEFVFAGFAGDRETYWGSNYIKLHSEYLGLGVVALAVLGALGPRRRLVYWMGGTGLLFLLVALSESTPFYRVWWSVMPFVKQTRAPGMAFYVVGFVVAMFAGFGAERLERREGRAHVRAWLWIGGAVGALGLLGAIGAFAKLLAHGVEPPAGLPAGWAVTRWSEAASGIRIGGLLSGVALVATGGLALAWLRGRIPASALALGLPLLLGADLWRNARPFWTFTHIETALFRADPITERLRQAAPPYRVLNVNVYPGSALMAYGIPELLGHHGNELHRFDELLGGKNQWTNLFRSRNLWELYAVEYVVLPAGGAGENGLPGYRRVLEAVPTASGTSADLFQRETPAPYARLVPAAVKAEDERAIPTVLDPRLALGRVVLLAPEAPVEPEPVGVLPAALAAQATVEEWAPGRMLIRLTPPAPEDAYLLVSENWYPEWRARVNGAAAPVVRGDVSLLTVPVPKGADVAELTYESAAYGTGKAVTLVSLGLVVLGLALPPVVRRRKRSG